MNNLLSKKRNELTRKKKGFTLVELVIVIAIIAILAAMAIPKFSSVRVDAKVSNDVVEAKNIQTQVATEIANGTILIPTSTAKVSTTDIISKLDGKVTGGYAEAKSTYEFYYTVDSEGNTTVSVGDGTNSFQLAPEVDGDTGRSGYAKEVAK